MTNCYRFSTPEYSSKNSDLLSWFDHFQERDIPTALVRGPLVMDHGKLVHTYSVWRTGVDHTVSERKADPEAPPLKRDVIMECNGFSQVAGLGDTHEDTVMEDWLDQVSEALVGIIQESEEGDEIVDHVSEVRTLAIQLADEADIPNHVSETVCSSPQEAVEAPIPVQTEESDPEDTQDPEAPCRATHESEAS